MKTRFPARTALVTALALAFGAPVFAADQLAQSSTTSGAGSTAAQDGTRSTDPQVNPGQSGFNDWTQRNNTVPATRGNAQDTTTRDAGTDGRMQRNDAGTATGAGSSSTRSSGAATGGQYGSSGAQDGTRSTDPSVNPGQSGFNDWTQRNTTGTRGDAQGTTTRSGGTQDRASGMSGTGTMRDGAARDGAGHRGMMMNDGRMGDAMRRHHGDMMRGDAAARQDRLNQVEPGASETRVWLYPDSGNAQAD